MTHLETVPQPSCPLCGTNSNVGRDRVGGHHVYLCSDCWTVFTGGTDEWEQWRKKRERRASWRTTRGVDA